MARPERDRGIDLIAYMDLVPPFTAVPIQMKASAGTAVTLLRKYEKFDRLLTILVWNALDARKVEFFGLSRSDVDTIANAQGWSTTVSWRGNEPENQDVFDAGGYHVTSASRDLTAMLRERYQLQTHRDWQDKVESIAATNTTISTATAAAE